MGQVIEDGEPLSSGARHGNISVLADDSFPKGLSWYGAKTCLQRLHWRIRKNWMRELWDYCWCRQPKNLTASDLARALEAFHDENRSYELDEQSPVFLLSTGWRSGSTLLQRIIVTDPNVLLWGEPFGDSAIFSQMAQMLYALAHSPDIRLATQRNDMLFSSLPTSWIATLYPSASEFRGALQAFVFAWLGESAKRHGFGRWGLKEVRLGATEAILLHWLFPKSKFILLSRNPFDCYRSLAGSGWHHIYLKRPDIRVDSAAGIAKHWNRIAVSWLELPKSFPMFRVRYEDVVDNRFDFRDLESWLGIKLNESAALSKFVGSTTRRAELGLLQRRIIAREARAGISALGYSQDSRDR
jgi:hypothetical protein